MGYNIPMANIRNFSIIAHVDHGKSTLADRFLEIGGLKPRVAREQVLDSNPIERERGITIKLAPVRLEYGDYIFNLIDTPGHVDFSYEVSRALAAGEGAILLVDATSGVQAQTLAHTEAARKLGLTILPVINKVDLANADVAGTRRQLGEFFGFTDEEILEVSAKTGLGVKALLAAVAARIPPPRGRIENPLRALIFNSFYDLHRGVIAWVRVIDGTLQKGEAIRLMATGAAGKAEEVGYFKLREQPRNMLLAGDVGYLVPGLRDPHLVRVGDTLVASVSTADALPGYQPPLPLVYLSLYPAQGEHYSLLRTAMEKLSLSDSSLIYTPEASPVLGYGLRCGFLGLLHADITQERLEREFGVATFATAPSVEYEIHYKDGRIQPITAAGDFPDPEVIQDVREPVVSLTILTPVTDVGPAMTLTQEKRGHLVNLVYIGTQAKLTYKVPLAEIIVDYADRLKSVSHGFATIDYEFSGWQSVDVVKLEVSVAGQKVEPLTQLVVRSRLEYVARRVVEKIKEVIPRHSFEIAIQATLGGRVLARSDVKAYRKDVLAKLSGGDQTRKLKQLEKQKRGKARLKQFGRVSLPQEAFIELLKT
jgi:GTP-binding protein LepA